MFGTMMGPGGAAIAQPAKCHEMVRRNWVGALLVKTGKLGGEADFLVGFGARPVTVTG